MIETKHKCDLCDTTYAVREQWHATAVKNEDETLNYSHSDIVPFPPGWEKVGVRIVCDKCLALLRPIIVPNGSNQPRTEAATPLE